MNYVIEAMRKRLGLVDAHLRDGRDYMAAGRFTAADISVGWSVGIAKYFGVVETLEPAVQAYFERVTARPAYKKAAG